MALASSVRNIFDDLFDPKHSLDVGAVIKQFYSRMSLEESATSTDSFLTAVLAPSFGELKDDSAIKKMDDNLKAMVALSMEILSNESDRKKRNDQFLTWEDVLAVFKTNVSLEPFGGDINHYDRFTKEGHSWFKFDGSPNPAVVNEVKSWFNQLVSDDDVIRSTQINIDIMAKIVAQTGAAVTNIFNLMTRHVTQEKTLVDIGVLRFPDIDSPFFKIYHIKLTAWSDCNRFLAAQDDINGIAGEFHSHRFRPRRSCLDALSPEIKKMVGEEATDQLLSFFARSRVRRGSGVSEVAEKEVTNQLLPFFARSRVRRGSEVSEVAEDS